VLRPPRRRPRLLPVLIVVLVLAGATGLIVKLTSHSAARCEASFVPAFFPPSDWGRALGGATVPAVMILNPASGPGTAPDRYFKTAVSQARDSGARVIGYIGTDYSQRPLAEAEQFVRDYRNWYGVTGFFLDQTPTSGTGQFGYYQSLTRYIHRESPDATIWLNPGAYPDQKYMSLASVVMTFEGPYSSYLTLRVPSWARQYPPSRFAHTVYATPRAVVNEAVRLSRSRNAGYVYLTDNIGTNPYSALPSYWHQEGSAIAGGCRKA
jgi:hypothetical protein